MPHNRPRVAGLLVILVSLVLAPGALAASPAKAPGAAMAKERAYGKHCGAKRKGADQAASRTQCLAAMARLATGRSSSPRNACRALSRKKAGGQVRSAFARCVIAGAKLLRSRGRVNSDGGTHELDEDDDRALEDDDGDESGDGTDPGDLDGGDSAGAGEGAGEGIDAGPDPDDDGS